MAMPSPICFGLNSNPYILFGLAYYVQYIAHELPHFQSVLNFAKVLILIWKTIFLWGII